MHLLEEQQEWLVILQESLLKEIYWIPETLNRNAEGVKSQLEKFLDFDAEENSAEMVNNYDWFKNMSFLRIHPRCWKTHHRQLYDVKRFCKIKA